MESCGYPISWEPRRPLCTWERAHPRRLCGGVTHNGATQAEESGVRRVVAPAKATTSKRTRETLLASSSNAIFRTADASDVLGASDVLRSHYLLRLGVLAQLQLLSAPLR